jgi:hypothetical protein
MKGFIAGGLALVAAFLSAESVAAPCNSSLSPPDQTVGIAGGALSISVDAVTSDCEWSVSTTAPWTVLRSPSSGTGSGSVLFDVERNRGPFRFAIITIGTAQFLLRQPGPGEIRRVSGDFTGDAAADLAIYRPSTGAWIIRGLLEATLGGRFQIPVPADYDGDAVTDPATFEPSAGMWRFADSSSLLWGEPGEIPVPADYDGDGRADAAVFRPGDGRWLIRNVGTFRWGMPADIPVPADFDGDGRADLAVFRRSTGTWWIRGQGAFVWGRGGDIPVAADYDGDGRADVAVFRPSTGEWLVRGQFTRIYGRAGDLPLPLDYDGDGRADVAIYRRSANLWAIDGAGSGVTLGEPGDVPATLAVKELLISPDDYDGFAGRDQAIFENTSQYMVLHWRPASERSPSQRSLRIRPRHRHRAHRRLRRRRSSGFCDGQLLVRRVASVGLVQQLQPVRDVRALGPAD